MPTRQLPSPPHSHVLHQVFHSLEEITAHSPLPAIPLQAPNALIRRLLARVEVLAVRLAILLFRQPSVPIPPL